MHLQVRATLNGRDPGFIPISHPVAKATSSMPSTCLRSAKFSNVHLSTVMGCRRDRCAVSHVPIPRNAPKVLARCSTATIPSIAVFCTPA